MKTNEYSRLGDRDLLRKLAAAAAQERVSTATLIALIAEVDSRRLYSPAGHSSMFEYCVHELRLSEGATYRRIRAGRVARRFPDVLDALREGRFNLTAIVLLAPHLTRENARELLAAAEGKNKPDIERLLAHRFPSPDVKTRLRAVPAPKQLTPASVASSGEPASAALQLTPASVAPPAVASRPVTKALSPKRFALQVTISERAHDQLRHAQALLSHQMPSGDIAQALELALDALVEKLEKRKFAATDKPRTAATRAAAKRTIPARVKRAVWKRDRAQCTFVSECGHRCAARKFLEFDHIDPVARGGEATVKSMRLRCRTHNQYEAEQLFGARFMEQNRAAAP